MSFLDYMLFEGGTDDSQNDSSSNDGSDTDPPEDADPTPPDDNPEEGNDDGGDNNDDSGSEDNPFDDADGSGDNDSDSGDSDSGSSSSSDSSSYGDEGGEDEIKKSEEELFSNLTPVEIEMKHLELKKNYRDLYDEITILIERINDIKKNTNTMKIAEYCSNVLSDLQEYIYIYLTKAYDKKSYTESAINFNRFLAVLKGVRDLLDTIELEDNKDE